MLDLEHLSDALRWVDAVRRDAGARLIAADWFEEREDEETGRVLRMPDPPGKWPWHASLLLRVVGSEVYLEVVNDVLPRVPRVLRPLLTPFTDGGYSLLAERPAFGHVGAWAPLPRKRPRMVCRHYPLPTDVGRWRVTVDMWAWADDRMGYVTAVPAWYDCRFAADVGP